MPRYELECGVVRTALKVVVYGPEGLGKSTLGAEFPSAVFIDVESGTKQLPVARLPRPSSWSMLLDEARAVRNGDVPCSTLVVDTADAAEALCIAHLCAKNNWDGIEGISYGKGYTYLAEEFGRLLDLLTEVVEHGTNVLIISHAIMRKFERPDELGAYDRFELKLTKKVAPMVKEWADMLLFCDYKTYVTTDKGGKAKASGGERVIRTTHNPCWDAKNRFDLPDELPMPLGTLPPELAAVVPDIQGTAGAKPAPATSKAGAPKAAGPAPATPRAMAEVDERLARMEADVAKMQTATTARETTEGDAQEPATTYERPGYPARMSALEDLMARDQVTDAELRHAVGQTGNFPETCAATDWEQGFVDYLVAGWDKMLKRIETNRVPVPFD